MRLISCHNGKLQHLGPAALKNSRRAFRTDLPAIDQLAPAGGFLRGAVHELLSDPSHGQPMFFAAILARCASGPLVWCDPNAELYPPALRELGIDLASVY